MVRITPQCCSDFRCRKPSAAPRQLVDRAVDTPAAQGRSLERPEAVGDDADQMRGDRLDVPAAAQARRRQLRIVERVDQVRDLPPLVGDGGEDRRTVEPTTAQTCSADRCELDVQFGESPHDECRLVRVAAGTVRTVILLGDSDVGHPVEDLVQ
jgi:hypothetical protein